MARAFRQTRSSSRTWLGGDRGSSWKTGAIMEELARLLAEAKTKGWSCTDAVSFDRLVELGRLQRLGPLRNRRSGPEIALLEPVPTAAAHPRSLSAISGELLQPLHTDGAHHQHPPEFILLSSTSVSEVPTLLWHFQLNGPARGLIHDLRHGLFTVRPGPNAFLAPAWHSGGIRYDPGCMTPTDARSFRVAAFFESQIANAVPFHWETPGRVLAISNHQVLHARSDASGEVSRQLRRAAFSAISVATAAPPKHGPVSV